MGTVRKLIVEVIDAQNLAPKDGHGTSSPYIKKTRTVVRDLNPVWNEMLSFNVGEHNEIFGYVLELDVYHDQKHGPIGRENSLGRVRLSSLVKKSLFNTAQGKIGLKIYYVDEEISPEPVPEKPVSPPPEKIDEAKINDTEKVEPPPAPPSEPSPESEKLEEDQPVVEKTEPSPKPEPKSKSESVTEGEDQVDVLPPEPFQMTAATISRSNSEIKFNGINGPQPIRRSSSAASFALEASISVSGSDQTVNSKPALKTTLFEWNQTFAFTRDTQDSSPILEITVWDPQTKADVENISLLGGICFDVNEIPVRDPPDSSLAPQWYRMEGGGAQHGDLMIATWIAKVYQSQKLWYLRVTVLEAQDISLLITPSKQALCQFQIRAQIGFQVLKTKTTVTLNNAISWNEDLVFVVVEPISISDYIVLSLENRQPKAPVTLGVVIIPLATIERRVDDQNVGSGWFTFEDLNEENKNGYKGRVNLRLCFDGGYHVMDEAAHVSSDYWPTTRKLWKPAVGTIELGIISCKNLIPMKMVNGKSFTDGDCVAKYGNKWVRTRTVSDSLDPKWNEQYAWKVFDSSTILTVRVFDSYSVFELSDSNTENTNDSTRHDFHIGKVRIHISMLQNGRVYKNVYLLLVLMHG
ncbi:hypothetical protein RYX36_007740, partial [Vicia faba]